MARSRCRMPYTLVLDGQEVDGHLEFWATPADRREYPQGTGLIEELTFYTGQEPPRPLLPAEERAATQRAIEWLMENEGGGDSR